MAAPREVEIGRLDLPQLEFLAKQLEEENTTLTANFNQLKQAQAKFADAAVTVGQVGVAGEATNVLVPLTSSLYVAGVLEPSSQVLVDVGTSFFVGKSPVDASALLSRKAALLKTNTESLYKVILEKREQLDTLAEAITMRQQQQQQQGGGGGRPR